jgi:hypothetical protein
LKSEPPEAIGKILGVVRLLPAGIDLRSYHGVYHALVKKDSMGLIAKHELGYTDSKRPAVITVDYLNERSVDFANSQLPYQTEAFEICLKGLPEEFKDYIGFPLGDVKSSYQKLMKRIQAFVNDRGEEHFGPMLEVTGLPIKDQEYTGWDIRLERANPKLSFNAFKKILEKTPGWIGKVQSDELEWAAWNYEFARTWYQQTYKLAHYIESWKKKEIPEMGIGMEVMISGEIVDRKIVYHPNDFSEAFNGLDIDRLGLCKNCRRVFWVKRTDMKGCTISCAKILRTRKWREKTTPTQRIEYKINRIKKNLKTIEE